MGDNIHFGLNCIFQINFDSIFLFIIALTNVLLAKNEAHLTLIQPCQISIRKCCFYKNRRYVHQNLKVNEF